MLFATIFSVNQFKQYSFSFYLILYVTCFLIHLKIFNTHTILVVQRHICLDCSLKLRIFYNLHNLQSTKDMLFVFLYLEMGMERPSKGKSNGGRITTYQKRQQKLKIIQLLFAKLLLNTTLQNETYKTDEISINKE